jgi:ATP-dependent protease ClpP protease subunit
VTPEFAHLIDYWNRRRRPELYAGSAADPEMGPLEAQVRRQRAIGTFVRAGAPIAKAVDWACEVFADGDMDLPESVAAPEPVPVQFGRTDWTYKMPSHSAEGVIELDLRGALDDKTGSRLCGQIRQAVKDPRTEAILLRIDSPGGLLSACIGTVLELERATAAKIATVAFVENQAASAAAVIACACDRVVVADDTGYGLAAHLMFHRPHSAPEAALQDGQATIAEIIARRRGESEARINELLGIGADFRYQGRAAVEANMADAVGSLWTARGAAISLAKGKVRS